MTPLATQAEQAAPEQTREHKKLASIWDGMTDDARQMLLSGGWRDARLHDRAVLELSTDELLHIDVSKAHTGEVVAWTGRLTPLGIAVRRYARPHRSDCPRDGR